ncbi:MAG: hypothetical protein WBM45_09950 [Woeseiaceae bacterium]
MKKSITSVLFVLAFLSSPTWAQDMTETALSCQDFNPTQEALQRFPDLVGACEAVVDRNGELYGRFSAIVRRASNSSVTLYLPATDHTFKVDPRSDARVLIGSRKVRPRDLQRGQEIQIYLSARQFSQPDIQEVTLVTESEVIIDHPVEEVAVLPTTG